MKDQDAKTLIETFHHYVDSFTNGEIFHRGTIIGVLKKACRNDARYRQVLKVLTGRTTSKLLNTAQWCALTRFVDPIKPEGGHWGSGHGDDVLDAWCNTLVQHADSLNGQMVLT